MTKKNEIKHLKKAQRKKTLETEQVTYSKYSFEIAT